jgi:hypothetical protein
MTNSRLKQAVVRKIMNTKTKLIELHWQFLKIIPVYKITK